MAIFNPTRPLPPLGVRCPGRAGTTTHRQRRGTCAPRRSMRRIT